MKVLSVTFFFFCVDQIPAQEFIAKKSGQMIDVAHQ
jgi:hypothetical protein